jgi:hypothetical protein
MEDEFLARTAADEEARRATYKEEVASAKLATVSQIVSGQVVIRPPGSNSPGRSRSPGAYACVCGDSSWVLGSAADRLGMQRMPLFYVMHNDASRQPAHACGL